jgi:hypothetical protein
MIVEFGGIRHVEVVDAWTDDAPSAQLEVE